MAIQIKFDAERRPALPTFVLATQSGVKLGALNNIDNVVLTDSLVEASEISFDVYKQLGDITCNLWDKIKDFRLVWCKEWDKWFSIEVKVTENASIVKNITAKTLGETELSQIMLYDVEINTEDDISRDDYDSSYPTVFYREDHTEASLLHRLLSKAPHYTIAHVDSTIVNEQRTFSFDSKSIADAFKEVAEELDCLFVYNSNSDSEGKITRTISVYDLDQTCLSCGYRGDFTDVCPKCGSTLIQNGYGQDTTVFVSTDALTEEVTFESDVGSTKNCFRLTAGDDEMTAAVRQCNLTKDGYMWYIPDETREDMSTELSTALTAYEALYTQYEQNAGSSLTANQVAVYNDLVNKYKEYDNTWRTGTGITGTSTTAQVFSGSGIASASAGDRYLNTETYYMYRCTQGGAPNVATWVYIGAARKPISYPVTTFSELMQMSYDVMDFGLYLQSSMMPTPDIDESTAADQVALLTAANLSPIGLEKLNTSTSTTTIENAISGMVKVFLDTSRFKYTVNTGTWTYPYNNNTSRGRWIGSFTVTSYEDSSDTATSGNVTITINTDYTTFTEQRINKVMQGYDEEKKYGIEAILDPTLPEATFKSLITKYCLDSLDEFSKCCQDILDVLIEQGAGKASTTSVAIDALYDDYYVPYHNMSLWLQSEIDVKSAEVYSLIGESTTDDDGNTTVITPGLEQQINSILDNIRNELDLETYLGTTLWKELCIYRREDEYKNENFVSDGLTNADLISKALDYLDKAKNEIYKSATLQHSISATLYNLLAIPEFEPILSYFSVGNWIRVRVDGKIYRLRLVDYQIDYADLTTLSVSFSDVTQTANGLSDISSLMDKASTLTSSFSAVTKQAEQGNNAAAVVSRWFENGMSATKTKLVDSVSDQNTVIDEHGILCRKMNPITETYDDEQLKIFNSTIAVTDDNWASTKTAIGKVYYVDPDSGELKEVFGVNAEAVIGKLLLGESLEIANESGTLYFNKDGFTIQEANNGPAFKVYSTDDGIVLDVGGKLVWDGDRLVVDGELKSSNITVTSKQTTYSGSTMAEQQIARIVSYVDERTGGQIYPVLEIGTVYLDRRLTDNTSDPDYYDNYSLQQLSNLYDSTFFAPAVNKIKIDNDTGITISGMQVKLDTPVVDAPCNWNVYTSGETILGQIPIDSSVFTGKVVVAIKLGYCQVFGAIKKAQLISGQTDTTGFSNWTEVLSSDYVPAPQHKRNIFQTIPSWTQESVTISGTTLAVNKRPTRIRISSTGGLSVRYGSDAEICFSITYPIEQIAISYSDIGSPELF